VDDLRRRKERIVAGRRAFPEVKSYLLAVGVYGDIPLIVEMDDVFEALEDAVMHVCFREIRRRSFVRAAHARSLEEPSELGNVARNIFVKPGPIRRRIWVGTQTVIDVPGPE